MKYLLAAIFTLIASASLAACPAGSTCTQYDGTVPYAVTGGTTTRTSASRAADVVNIKEFGAVGDFTTDNTIAIQAAIDYAYAHSIQTIFCPAGVYKTTTALFLDAPGASGGLRGIHAAYSAGTTYASGAVVTYLGVPWQSLSAGNVGHTPSTSSTFWAQEYAPSSTQVHFSMAFVGERGGLGNYESAGCQIKPNYNNGVGIWVGSGNGMSIRNISVSGTTSLYRGLQSSSGVGIAIAGGNGGENRGVFEDIVVNGFYTAFETGVNSDGLGAENTFRKVVFNNCHVGILFAQSQNDINDVIEPSNGGCTTAIKGQSGRPVNIWSGNLSSSGIAGKFTISSVSALTAAACRDNSTALCYTFTATITSPDAYVGTVYNSYMLRTADFGVVPATMDSFNSGTSVGTFTTYFNWGFFNFQDANAKTATSLEANIQAVATLYATERVTALDGPAFHVAGGTWMENAAACTTFIISRQNGFNGDKGSLIERVFFNYDPSSSGYATSLTETLAYFYCQQSFPFIAVDGGSGDLTFQSVNFNQSVGSDPIVIDIDNYSTFSHVYFKATALFNPVVRTTGVYGYGGAGGSFSGGGITAYTAGYGGGEWDATPFGPSNGNAYGGQLQGDWYRHGIGLVPFVGYRAAPWATARLTPTIFTTLSSIAGVTLGTYPLVHGGTLYSTLNPYTGANAAGKLFATSAHIGWSYGQNLTTTNVGVGLAWSTVGRSFVVKADAATLSWLYPGLGVKLNTSSNNHYIVTGAYPSLGYFTVLNSEQDSSPYYILGTSGTAYSGVLIGQDAYTWTQY